MRKHKRVKLSDPDLLAKLAEYQCTDEEISEITGLSIEDLKEIDGPLRAGRALGRKILREALYKLATEGNKSGPVAIWLSKQYLGMKDKTEHSGDLSLVVEIVNYADRPTK